jgi:hypothetical protein
MSKQGVFRGGRPTDAEINNLRESFPDSTFTEGQVIPYPIISKVIGEEKNTHRWRTITYRWRRMVERESGIVIGCERGLGFKILNNEQRFELSESKHRSGKKMIRRGLNLTVLVDREELTDAQQARLDHKTKVGAAFLVYSRMKTLPSLPKLNPSTKD